MQLIIDIFVPHVNYATFSQWRFISLHLRSSKYWPVIKIPARSCYRLVNENNITNTLKNFFTPWIFHVFCGFFLWKKGIFCIRRKKVLANSANLQKFMSWNTKIYPKFLYQDKLFIGITKLVMLFKTSLLVFRFSFP